MAYRGYVFVVVIIIILLLANLFDLVPFGAAALSFDYDFSVGDLKRANLLYLNDSFADGDKISLTKMTVESASRVAYKLPIRLWDCRTGTIASFSTSFSFAIDGYHNSTRGDGMAFFIGPFPPIVPPDSFAGFLGLYNNPAHSGSPPVVAVEFDTFWNQELDPPLPSNVSDHVGIDINSIHSTSYTTDLKNLSLYGTMFANITYDAGSKMMTVSLELEDGSIHRVQALVDLIAAGLPQDAAIGFSAATGAFWESHQLLSWSFNSTDMADVPVTDPPCKTRLPLRICMFFQAGMLAVAFLLIAALLYYICMLRRRLGISLQENENPVATELPRQELLEATNSNLPNDNTKGPISLPENGNPVATELTRQELLEATNSNLPNDNTKGPISLPENENPVATELPRQEVLETTSNNLPNDNTKGLISLPVPREFSYKELSAATDAFSSDRKLGEGAFGEVYRGDLPGQLEVAVKRLTRQLERTRRDYVTEIMTLGQLHHRNLVELIGWCDDGEHLLLVYELMANRSVDRYLHNKPVERLLNWKERYDIVLSVGYAIEYLHTGCPTLILHRDIKPSNVMLNDKFKAKLGDFGLVREMEPEQGSLGGTTMVGDMAYLDPVCVSNRTVSIESDVYSFGVLLLEIATGIRPAAAVQGTGGLLSNTLVNAVQESDDRGQVLGMADRRLELKDDDKRQMERVLAVGLLCVQEERKKRPKIREAVNLLSDLSQSVPQIVSQ